MSMAGVMGQFGAKARQLLPSSIADAKKELEEFLRPKGDQTEASFVQERYAYAKHCKDCMTQTWATCLAFYVGEQWRRWDTQGRRLVANEKIPTWRVLMKNNLIPGYVNRGASKLIRSRELPRAVPLTGDTDDTQAADGGTRVLKSWWRTSGMEQVEHEANVNRILFGCAFLHDYWDPSKKVWVPQPQQGIDPRSGYPSMQQGFTEAAVGDVCPECLTVFDVFPEPCERWDDVSWCVVARRKPISWFRSVFGQEVEPDRGAENDLLGSLIPGAFGGEGAAAPKGSGQATLLIYYEAAGKDNPHGRTVMTCGSKVLFSKKSLPMPHGKIPLTMMPYRYVPKRQWPKGVVEELIDPQRELNRSESNLAELSRLYRGPKRWINRRWNVDPKAITTSPDEIVEGDFNGDNPTQWVEQPPSLPPWIQERTDQMQARMQELAGQHDVSEGQTPPGVTAASAIQLLQGADNEHLSMPALLGKIALEEFAGRILDDVAKLYREDRLILTYGRDKSKELTVLKGSQIGARDVIVDLTNGVEDTDQVRTEQLLGWYGNPLLAQQPLEIQTALLKATGMGWIAQALTEGTQAAQQAQGQPMDPQQQLAIQQQQQQLAAGQQQMQGVAADQENAQAQAEQEQEAAQQQQAIQAAQARQQAEAQARQQETAQQQAAQAMAQQHQAHQQKLSHAEEKHQVELLRQAHAMQLAAQQAAKAKQQKPQAGKGK